jgi:DNA-binding NtrC family response regulator
MNGKILLAMPPERQLRFLNILESENYDVALAADASRADAILAMPSAFDVVIVDADLPGGGWKPVLDQVIGSRPECEVLVYSRCGEEELWADVIQCGAFDLIPEPLTRSELVRIVGSARNSEYLRRFSHIQNAEAS